MHDHIRERLMHVLESNGLDALIATTTENVFYAGGLQSIVHAIFHGLEVYAVFTRGGTALVVPAIEAASIAANGLAVDRVACYGTFFVEYSAGAGGFVEQVRKWTRDLSATGTEALVGVVSELGLRGRRVGLDEGNLFPQTWRALEERLGAETLVPAYQLFRQARAVKSAEEIACLESAAQIAEDGIASVVGVLKPGLTEREAVSVYEQTIIRLGASPYFTVITFGERSACPVAPPSDYALRRGDLIRFDLGCVYRGYRSDIGRTAVLGKPTEKHARYHAALVSAEEAAIAAIRPGARLATVFDAAMEAARNAGLPGYQRHHVGHGIGLEPYDPPSVTPGNADVLETGMVLCIETPYYEQGWGGLQAEDTMEVTARDARLLTRSARRLIVAN